MNHGRDDPLPECKEAVIFGTDILMEHVSFVSPLTAIVGDDDGDDS